MLQNIFISNKFGSYEHSENPETFFSFHKNIKQQQCFNIL